MLDGDAREVKCFYAPCDGRVASDAMFWSVPARHRGQLIAVLESMCVMLRDAGPES